MACSRFGSRVAITRRNLGQHVIEDRAGQDVALDELDQRDLDVVHGLVDRHRAGLASGPRFLWLTHA